MKNALESIVTLIFKLDKRDALNDIKRVLKPQGIVLIVGEPTVNI